MAINIFEGARRIALLLGGGAAVITTLVAFNQDAYYHAQYSLAAPNAPFKKTDSDCQSEGHTIYFDHKTSSGKKVSVSLCLEPMTFTNKNTDAELLKRRAELVAKQKQSQKEKLQNQLAALVAQQKAGEGEKKGSKTMATDAELLRERAKLASYSDEELLKERAKLVAEQKAGERGYIASAGKEETELIPYKTDADGMTWGAKPYSTEISIYETQVKKRFTMTATDEEASNKKAAKQWRSQFADGMGYLVAGLAIFGAFVWATGWIVRGFLGIPRGMDRRPDL